MAVTMRDPSKNFLIRAVLTECFKNNDKNFKTQQEN